MHRFNMGNDNPVRNTKLLREAYNAGRRQALNEQNIPDMFGNPSRPGGGGGGSNTPSNNPGDNRYRGNPGGGNLGGGGTNWGTPSNTPPWWARPDIRNPFTDPKPGPFVWDKGLGQWVLPMPKQRY